MRAVRMRLELEKYEKGPAVWNHGAVPRWAILLAPSTPVREVAALMAGFALACELDESGDGIRLVPLFPNQIPPAAALLAAFYETGDWRTAGVRIIQREKAPA